MKILVRLKNVYASIGNKGFTIAEALLGLAAFCLMTALLPMTIQMFSMVEQMNPRLQAMQLQIFSSQIKKEIRMSQKIDPQSNRLILSKDNESILYELSGTNIRRRVNLTGNEILLQNVNKVQFESVKNGVIVKIENIWKENDSFSVRTYINTGN